MRGTSCLMAVVYMFFELFVFSDWIYQLYIDPKENIGFIDVMVNMFIGYTMVFNLLLLPVNLVIVITEITIRFSPLLLEKNKKENP